MGNITKEKFDAYLEVQRGGQTNMFHIPMVIILSGGILTMEDCLTIMKNYSELENKFFNEAEDECTECGYNENECTC